MAGQSSHVNNPDEAEKLHQQIDSFLKDSEPQQQERMTKISSLSTQLYGDSPSTQVSQNNMIELTLLLFNARF